MSQLNGLLNIGGNSLLLQQQALTVTGNNISNGINSFNIGFVELIYFYPTIFCCDF